ncbi:DUF3011 family protein [Luteibacter rhizovicinus]|uniref:DUF3011 family protein n=1 Tax=Luteibacter rhizovicinus TaxID=242606 RepID=A0A4R3YNJ4_9GAMM|nr:DUF3011 domain-containing protein [Luteibacter rhizovicinus]TCV93920.1 DUF3011 family protein [Luteibacter rhizovicinus]
MRVAAIVFLVVIVTGLTGAWSFLSQALAQEGPVTCESQDARFTRCFVTWQDAKVVKGLSKAYCERGVNWGLDREGLWVDRGCRARFAEVSDRESIHVRRARIVHADESRDRDRTGVLDRDRGHGGFDWARPYDETHRAGEARPGGATSSRVVECNSRERRYRVCLAGRGNHDGRMIRQLSDARCQEGYSWGWNRAGVWVDKGCRGIFEVYD